MSIAVSLLPTAPIICATKSAGDGRFDVVP